MSDDLSIDAMVERIIEVIEVKSQGYSNTATGNKCGVSRTSVKNYLDKYSGLTKKQIREKVIRLDNARKNKVHGNKKSAEEKADTIIMAIQMRAEGNSYAEIADEIGSCKISVRNYCVKYTGRTRQQIIDEVNPKRIAAKRVKKTAVTKADIKQALKDPWNQVLCNAF